MGDVKGAARDTNRLYHRKHLYHYEYKSVQYTGSRNVLDLLTEPEGAPEGMVNKSNTSLPPTCVITMTCLPLAGAEGDAVSLFDISSTPLL